MKKITLDWNEYFSVARQAVAEGCVLLENKNNVLPLACGTKVSVFGRIQNYYYKSGTGSGGMVNVSAVTDIVKGLEESGAVEVNKTLRDIYSKWEAENPADAGLGWGSEPWSQKEMPLDDSVAKDAASVSDVALVIIGRTAGEDRDASDAPGSYRLTEDEEKMLKTVRSHFKKVVVLLNVGGIIDMSFVETCMPDAVMYVWQGGMVGGLGVADVLTGKVSPSGKLTDTIARNISDYPAHENFGDGERNYYKEDIYTGYRYFETFAKDKVIYPFGYGLSYTKFKIECSRMDIFKDKEIVDVYVTVKNVGGTAGKEVVQVYAGGQPGELGKPSRVLVAFKKTGVIEPGCSEELKIQFSFAAFASYDDSGKTGHIYSYVIEKGHYEFYVGSDVRSAQTGGMTEFDETLVIEECTQALAPVLPFDRLTARLDSGAVKAVYEPAPLLAFDESERRLKNLPAEIPFNSETSFKLKDVLDGKATMEQFIAQMTDDDLSCIIRGEGMGSSRVTAGTASAFGAASDRLQNELGLPAICCDDGPSGMRLDCGTKAFSLPNGTMLGCTFNVELNEKLFEFLGMEMISNRVECLLGPGMNIHRHPLNGRNFEYFSEDPLVTGKIAAAQLNGLHKNGVTGTIKHFCGNNQEFHRRVTDAVVSERALREIYLKGYEIAVKEGGADSIMTAYGAVNGLWTASSYDLTTTILRNEWGFKGIVMTDWWAAMNERGKEWNNNNFAAMVRAQNDVYMVVSDSSKNAGDNTLEALADGTLCRSELQRCAMNICSFAMKTQAMARLTGDGTAVEIINRPLDADDEESKNVEFQKVDKEITIPLDYKVPKKGTNYVCALEITNPGTYDVILTGSSELTELAQIPCTMFYTSIPVSSFTFNGSNGNDVSIERNFKFRHRCNVMRLYVGANGLKLKSIKFVYRNSDTE